MADRQLAFVKARGDEDLAALAVVSLLEHPLGFHGMLRPQNEDARDTIEFLFQLLPPIRAVAYIGVPEHRNALCLQMFGKLRRYRSVLLGIAQEDVFGFCLAILHSCLTSQTAGLTKAIVRAPKLTDERCTISYKIEECVVLRGEAARSGGVRHVASGQPASPANLSAAGGPPFGPRPLTPQARRPAIGPQRSTSQEASIRALVRARKLGRRRRRAYVLGTRQNARHTIAAVFPPRTAVVQRAFLCKIRPIPEPIAT